MISLKFQFGPPQKLTARSNCMRQSTVIVHERDCENDRCKRILYRTRLMIFLVHICGKTLCAYTWTFFDSYEQYEESFHTQKLDNFLNHEACSRCSLCQHDNCLRFVDNIRNDFLHTVTNLPQRAASPHGFVRQYYNGKLDRYVSAPSLHSDDNPIFLIGFLR